MHWRNTDHQYGTIAQLLHWLIALLLIAQFSLGFMAEDLPVSMERLVLLARHKSLGMTLFLLMLARLCWRLYSPPPPLPPSLATAERRLARATQVLFYLALLTLPLLGWMASSASNLSVSWFGWFTWPDLVSPDKVLAEKLKTAHAWMGGLLLALITLHVVAALRHQLVLRDGLLWRMLPVARHREE